MGLIKSLSALSLVCLFWIGNVALADTPENPVPLREIEAGLNAYGLPGDCSIRSLKSNGSQFKDPTVLDILIADKYGRESLARIDLTWAFKTPSHTSRDYLVEEKGFIMEEEEHTLYTIQTRHTLRLEWDARRGAARSLATTTVITRIWEMGWDEVLSQSDWDCE